MSVTSSHYLELGSTINTDLMDRIRMTMMSILKFFKSEILNIHTRTEHHSCETTYFGKSLGVKRAIQQT